MTAPDTGTAPKRRTSLWLRISVLGIAVAVVTGVLAGALAIGLIRSAETRNARSVLSQLADATVKTADRTGRVNVVGVKARVGVLRVRFGELTAAGQVVPKQGLVADALTLHDRNALLGGTPVSATSTVGGRTVLVEGRPLATGGAIVLVQARADATAGGEQAIRRTIVAILIGVGAAALLAVLVAARIARPLRRAAQAAHALAAGHRDVAIEPAGPAEVAEVADAVNLLAAELRRSEGRQRDFLLSVSHDLRTPLTAITGYAESLAGDVVPPERVGEVGAVMLSEAHRLERLVGDLLDLARLGAQDFRIDLAGVDLMPLADGAAAVWARRCSEVGVLFDLQEAPAVAWTDASRLRQVLDGLMENALRVTPAGRPIVLAVRTDPDGRAVAEVRDGGPGLSDDDLAVAFQRSELYRRYQGVRRVGTGLGLAIVHGLVTRLGGTVEAGHAREGGARFTVRLPSAGPPTS